ncbi:hypothetical protein M409DRAFT_20474 [Zasmidium cellare ATCC 36951]|uniref:F-box domain-containing protein n=1 Tax=Zasmidium cellare ATCC 36951 TaxID=1080233 RepID=A0A6A6CQA2_ZASCE|nr:uncharacterized protein M409DRAFT_20474 [Zasmidium cellare ATCC 36951]KAF2169251.1 hypothetical protein M409DRAFT_20474 [Zasmidium cellare ATCC 36951]
MTDNSAMAATSAFRLMDLPPEIRNRIFSYALPGKGNNTLNRNVANFRFPALSRVSREVRRQTLPIFFAEFDFVFNVGTNVTSLSDDNQEVACHETKLAGTLGFLPQVQRFITDAGQAAVFRKVTVYVQKASFTEYTRYTPDQTRCFTLFRLTLDVKYGHVRIEVLEGTEHPRNIKRKLEEGELEAVDKMIESVAARLAEIESRKDFKGLTLKDLRQIAKGFRVENQ